MRYNGELIWCAKQKWTESDDVAVFYNRIVNLARKVPHLVIIDSAAIHKGEVMNKKRRQGQGNGWICITCYRIAQRESFPVRVEAGKAFWRRSVGLIGQALHDRIDSLMKGFGTVSRVNFA